MQPSLLNIAVKISYKGNQQLFKPGKISPSPQPLDTLSLTGQLRFVVLGDLDGSDELVQGIILDTKDHRRVPYMGHIHTLAPDDYHAGRGAGCAGEPR